MGSGTLGGSERRLTMSSSGTLSNYYVDSLIGHEGDEVFAARFGPPGPGTQGRPAGVADGPAAATAEFASCSFAPKSSVFSASWSAVAQPTGATTGLSLKPERPRPPLQPPPPPPPPPPRPPPPKGLSAPRPASPRGAAAQNSRATRSCGTRQRRRQGTGPGWESGPGQGR